MSAFVVSDHVIHVATRALIAHERRPADPTALGQALWRMNVDAVTQRYRLLTREGGPEDRAAYLEDIAGYRYALIEGLSAAATCKQVDCLLYQCLEGDVPETNPLFARLEAAATELARPLGGEHRHDHPDYARAPWGLEPLERAPRQRLRV